MYIDVKMGKRGEIVIPVLVRRSLKLKEGGTVKLRVEDNSVSLLPAPKEDFITWLSEHVKKHGLPHEKIIYGDKLFEEGF